jgi:hypothetical protein
LLAGYFNLDSLKKKKKKAVPVSLNWIVVFPKRSDESSMPSASIYTLLCFAQYFLALGNPKSCYWFAPLSGLFSVLSSSLMLSSSLPSLRSTPSKRKPQKHGMK